MAAAADIAAEGAALEQSILGKVIRHISPILAMCYFAAILDRSNVGYAGLTMNKDLAFSATVFGFGDRYLLHRLFHLRGAEQCDSRKSRGATVDRPHHADLGVGVGRDCFCLERHQLLRDAVPARRRRGRVYSRAPATT